MVVYMLAKEAKTASGLYHGEFALSGKAMIQTEETGKSERPFCRSYSLARALIFDKHG